jgi:glycine/D-amino acid oxidase-like deaminating enzyme
VREHFDAIVIGGGIVGAAIALHLVDAGERTLLVDGHLPGRATDAGAGILTPQTALSEDPVWVELCLASGAHYPALHERLLRSGAKETGYQRCGLVKLALRDTDLPAFEWVAHISQGRGRVREISPDDARARFPALAPVQRALHNPDAARVDGRSLRAAVLLAARSAGLEHREPAHGELMLDGGRVTGVAVDGAPVACDRVAIAGGAWTPDIAAQLGVPTPVVPHRGQIVHLMLDGADTGSWPIAQPVFGYYMVPWPGGRVAVGATVEPEAEFDVRATAGGVHEVLRETLRVAPGLRNATLAEVRVGLRPTTPDDHPILGSVPGHDNVFVATGHGANGLLLGPYSGQLVAQALLGREPDHDLAPFALARFGAG